MPSQDLIILNKNAASVASLAVKPHPSSLAGCLLARNNKLLQQIERLQHANQQEYVLRTCIKTRYRR